MNRIEIRQTIITNFNSTELRDLCYSVSVDYDSLPAQGRAGKARELIMFMERRERTDDLIQAISNFSPAASVDECEYCGMKKCGCGYK